MSRHLESLLYEFRSQMRRTGFVTLHTNHGYCTVADGRAASDALLCENQRLNAVALRWNR